MAITTQKSNQVTAATSRTATTALNTTEDYGKLRTKAFDFTQSGAGDIGSTVDLIKLPPGKVKILFNLSHWAFSAFGAARTLDIGYAAYKDATGTTVAASANAFDDDVDVSAALSNVVLGSDVTGLKVATFTTLEGLTIFATVAGGTIPANATLNGYFTFVVE